jgi:hypothetical protein
VTLSASLIADCFVSLAAFCGLLMFMAHVPKGEQASPLGRRILFGMSVLAVLMLARVLLWLTGLGVFSLMTLTAAACVPLSALLLTEGLLRRHAPRVLKLFVAAGTLLFALLAWLPVQWVNPERLLALFAFQFGALAAIGWVVVMRDRSSLSARENISIDRLALSLLVILPLLASDFQLGTGRWPVRLGGIGILVLCWLGLSLNRPTMRHRDTLTTGLVLLFAAALATAAVALITTLTGPAFLQVFAVFLAAILMTAVYGETVKIRGEGRRDGVLRHLATADTSDFARFLAGLMSHPNLQGGVVLNTSDLGDFNQSELASLFAANPVRTRADLKGKLGASESEQLGWLLERFEATHILLIREQPLTLLALAMPDITHSAGALTELTALQRMCVLIAGREGRHDPIG